MRGVLRIAFGFVVGLPLASLLFLFPGGASMPPRKKKGWDVSP
jgi:hypothetical protein